MPDPLVEVRNLTIDYWQHRAWINVVNRASFTIQPGEAFALVGESGCGKSTTGRLILRLMEPTSGSVRFKGQEIARLEKAAMRRMRRHMQIIFQDPYASLNPRLTVGETLAEPLNVSLV